MKKCKDCVRFKNGCDFSNVDTQLQLDGNFVACGQFEAFSTMKDKVEKYIVRLEEKIQEGIDWVEQNMNNEACKVAAMEARIQALEEVKNDLKHHLEEIG